MLSLVKGCNLTCHAIQNTMCSSEPAPAGHLSWAYVQCPDSGAAVAADVPVGLALHYQVPMPACS